MITAMRKSVVSRETALFPDKFSFNLNLVKPSHGSESVLGYQRAISPFPVFPVICLLRERNAENGLTEQGIS